MTEYEKVTVRFDDGECGRINVPLSFDSPMFIPADKLNDYSCHFIKDTYNIPDELDKKISGIYISGKDKEVKYIVKSLADISPDEIDNYIDEETASRIMAVEIEKMKKDFRSKNPKEERKAKARTKSKQEITDDSEDNLKLIVTIIGSVLAVIVCTLLFGSL